MMLNKFDLNATYTWVMTTTMTSGKEYFFGDITKKAFGNSTQKLYFIRNNSFHHFYPHVAPRDFLY